MGEIIFRFISSRPPLRTKESSFCERPFCTREQPLQFATCMTGSGRKAPIDADVRRCLRPRDDQRPRTDAGPGNKNGGNPTDSGHCAHCRRHHQSRSSSVDSHPPSADRRPRTIRRSISHRTGTPSPNRNPSTSSTSRCSGSRLPSPGLAGDAPLPVPVVIVSPASRARSSPKRRFAPRLSPSDRTAPLQRTFLRCYVPLTPAAMRLDFLSPRESQSLAK